VLEPGLVPAELCWSDILAPRSAGTFGVGPWPGNAPFWTEGSWGRRLWWPLRLHLPSVSRSMNAGWAADFLPWVGFWV